MGNSEEVDLLTLAKEIKATKVLPVLTSYKLKKEMSKSLKHKNNKIL